MRKEIKPLIPFAVAATLLAGASPAMAAEADSPVQPDVDQTQNTPDADQTQTTPDDTDDQNVLAEGDNGGWHIKLLDATKTGKSYDGQNVLMVSAEVTNNTGKDATLGSVRFKAYQNGEEIKTTIPAHDDVLNADYEADSDLDEATVKDGETQTAREFFAVPSDADTDTIRVDVYANSTDENVITGEFTPSGEPVVDEDVPTENPVVAALSDVSVTVSGFDLEGFDPSVTDYYVPSDVIMGNLPDGWTATPSTDEQTGDVTWHVENSDKTLSADYVFHKINLQEDSTYGIDDLKDMKLMATTDGDPFEVEGFDAQQIDYVVPGVTGIDVVIPDGWHKTILHDEENQAFVIYVTSPDNTYFAGYNVTAEAQQSEDGTTDGTMDGETDTDSESDAAANGGTSDTTADDGDATSDSNANAEDSGLPQTGVAAPFVALAGIGMSALAGLGVKLGFRKHE